MALILPHLVKVPLVLRQPVEVKRRSIAQVYFVERGFISVVTSGRMPAVEIGLIGNEGFAGWSLMLGVSRSPFDAYVQAAGEAARIDARVLLECAQKSDALREVLLKFVYVFFVQAASTSAAASGTIDQRLARWLLMAHDRLGTDNIKLTHHLLSLMLGVQRPGVTLALASLQKQGLIATTRGSITVLDRAGLENLAGALYGWAEAELERLL